MEPLCRNVIRTLAWIVKSSLVVQAISIARSQKKIADRNWRLADDSASLYFCSCRAIWGQSTTRTPSPSSLLVLRSLNVDLCTKIVPKSQWASSIGEKISRWRRLCIGTFSQSLSCIRSQRSSTLLDGPYLGLRYHRPDACTPHHPSASKFRTAR
jgi:hypothetical protein